MTRQNRVLPTGEIVAAPFRGTLFGNRGVLHDEAGRIRRAWGVRRWIACLLVFRGRRRPVMQPGRYTGLFFCDEASAFAAGHRPCAECRRADYERFRDGWVTAFGGPRPSADAMDAALHAARVVPGSTGQRRAAAALADLPDGAFVLDPEGAPALVQAGWLHPYRLDHYGAPTRPSPGTVLTVLTPAPILAVFAAGYGPGSALRR
ncbi:MAG: hypothetical protein JWR08_2411 [Enterovirga sp.]|nr:hypothetical protein [Enterovirga sp.]